MAYNVHKNHVWKQMAMREQIARLGFHELLGHIWLYKDLYKPTVSSDFLSFVQRTNIL